MIEDPELLQLVHATTELLTLQSLAAVLQSRRDMSDELEDVVDAFNTLQQVLVERMSQRIVELALLKQH